jgi:uncharacterized repeat protein (TIGR01451 family)
MKTLLKLTELKKLFFFFILLLNCVKLVAQNPNGEPIYFDKEIRPNNKPLPKGTKIIDMWGYPWVNPYTTTPSVIGNTLGTENVISCNAFNLTFRDFDLANGKGFDDQTIIFLPVGHPLGASSKLGELRRWTACKVFEYIGQTIIIQPSSSPPDIFFDVSQLDGTGALAFATPFFSTMAPTNSFLGGFLQQHITSNTDPTPYDGDFDGKITCDFGPNNAWPSNGQNIPINSDEFNLTAGGIDLYSVLLHEITHLLGFFSNIQSTGTSSQTNTTTGKYSLFDRYIYNNTSPNSNTGVNTNTGPSLINNSTFSFQGTVANLTSNNLRYFKSTNSKSYSIYSPTAWKSGSSLSHFDDTRDNGETYLMTAAYSGGLRRTYTKSELEVLCNLGYSVTVNLFSCSDRYAVGVDDNTTTIINAATAAIDVIANDYDPDGQPIVLDPTSVLLLSNAGSIAVVGNTIKFTPNGTFAGNVVIKYRPKTIATGYFGSYAKLTVNIQSPGHCPLDPCNLICNGGFEDGLSLPQFESIANISIGNTVSNGCIPGWNDLRPSPTWGSSDCYFRGSSITLTNGTNAFGIPYNFASYQNIQNVYSTPAGVETPTLINNNRYAGVYQGSKKPSGTCNYTNEGFYRQLAQPLVQGTSYKLTYFARAIKIFSTYPCAAAFLNTSFLVNPPPLNVFPTTANNCGIITGTNFNSSPIATNNTAINTWTPVEIIFTADANSNYIVIQSIASNEIYSGNNSDNPYIFVDNFRLEKVGNQISTTATTSNATPKIGDNVVFSVKVCNTSTTAVNNVSLTNLLPVGLTLVSSTFSAYPNHIFATLAAGQCVTLTVTATVSANVAFNTDLNNCASVTTANACAQTQSCVAVRVLATDISVSAIQSSCNKFKALISNIGTVDAHNVKLSYVPPSCFGYINYTVISGAASYSSNQITIPVILAGNSVIMEFNGIPPVSANCTNTLSLLGAYDEWDLNPSNNTGTIVVPMVFVASAVPTLTSIQTTWTQYGVTASLGDCNKVTEIITYGGGGAAGTNGSEVAIASGYITNPTATSITWSVLGGCGYPVTWTGGQNSFNVEFNMLTSFSNLDAYIILRCTFSNSCGSVYKDYAFYLNNPICTLQPPCPGGSVLLAGSSRVKSTEVHLQNNPKLSIIPNPSSGQFQLSLVTENNASVFQEVIITNKMGTQIFKQKYSDNKKSKNINLFNQPLDTYFVKVFDGKNWLTEKIIITK